MGRQTSFRLRAKRRMSYAFEVSIGRSWEEIFFEGSVKRWGRRARELQLELTKEQPPSGAVLSLAEANTAEVRLDWLVHMGGPLREVFDHYCDASGQNPGGLELVVSMAPDPVLIFEVRSWLKVHARRGTLFRVSADERWRSHLVDLKIPVKFERRVFGDRSRESVDRFLDYLWRDLTLDSHQRTLLLEASRRQIIESSDSEPPWSVCRGLGVWLKALRGPTKHRFSAAETFEIEKRGSLVLAFLSPQDEEQEAKSLDPRALMLNPTLEVLVRPAVQAGRNLKPLIVVGRYRDSMFEHELNIVEAAIMEFVRDSFRAPEAAVCSAVALELERDLKQGQQEVYQSLQRLKFEGLILSSDFQQNV